jgi:hypothetical protein
MTTKKRHAAWELHGEFAYLDFPEDCRPLTAGGNGDNNP